MAIRCVSPYKAGRLAFTPGEVVTDPAVAEHVLRDSPGSFEVIADAPPAAAETEASTRALAEPPKDKAIRPKRDAATTKADHPASDKE